MSEERSLTHAMVMKGEKMHEGKGGRHYKQNGDREVCEHMEDEAVMTFFETLLKTFSIRKSIKSALWAGCATKHEFRAGTKDGNSVDEEMAKANNYRHRQEAGEWISE